MGGGIHLAFVKPTIIYCINMFINSATFLFSCCQYTSPIYHNVVVDSPNCLSHLVLICNEFFNINILCLFYFILLWTSNLFSKVLEVTSEPCPIFIEPFQCSALRQKNYIAQFLAPCLIWHGTGLILWKNTWSIISCQ